MEDAAIVSNLLSIIEKEKRFLEKNYIFDNRHNRMSVEDIWIEEGGRLAELYSRADALVGKILKRRQFNPQWTGEKVFEC